VKDFYPGILHFCFWHANNPDGDPAMAQAQLASRVAAGVITEEQARQIRLRCGWLPKAERPGCRPVVARVGECK
jgi:hypothetical protein